MPAWSRASSTARQSCETIEFSPKEPFEQLMEVVGKNMEATSES